MTLHAHTGKIRLPFWFSLAAAFGALTIDQLTKYLIVNVVMVPPRVIEILPFLNFQPGFNTGLSFSLLADQLAEAVWLVIIVKLGIVLLLLFMAARALKKVEGIGLGLVMGGALGNISDRARLGGVIDFIDAHYREWHWPTFNMADVAITFGVGLLLITTFFTPSSKHGQNGKSLQHTANSQADQPR